MPSKKPKTYRDFSHINTSEPTKSGIPLEEMDLEFCIAHLSYFYGDDYADQFNKNLIQLQDACIDSAVDSESTLCDRVDHIAYRARHFHLRVFGHYPTDIYRFLGHASNNTFGDLLLPGLKENERPVVAPGFIFPGEGGDTDFPVFVWAIDQKNYHLTKGALPIYSVINDYDKSIEQMIESIDETAKVLKTSPAHRPTIMTSYNSIVASFAKYAISQSPYDIPTNLMPVLIQLVNKLQATFRTNETIDYTGNKDAPVGELYRKFSRVEFMAYLHNLLMEIEEFQLWNVSREKQIAGRIYEDGVGEFSFTFRYDKTPNLGTDFVDLNALVRNVYTDISMDQPD